MYVCTSVCTQLPSREINWLEGKKGGETAGGRRYIDPCPAVLELSKKKTGACVCVRGSRVWRQVL